MLHYTRRKKKKKGGGGIFRYRDFDYGDSCVKNLWQHIEDRDAEVEGAGGGGDTKSLDIADFLISVCLLFH